VRVLYAVEQNEDRVMRDPAYEIVGIRVARRGSDCENALVIRAISQPVKRNTGLAADGHSSTPRCFEYLAQPRITNAFGYHDAIDATRPRA
jgi:hypothetical protein